MKTIKLMEQTLSLSNRKPMNLLCYTFFIIPILERGRETACQAEAKLDKNNTMMRHVKILQHVSLTQIEKFEIWS